MTFHMRRSSFSNVAPRSLKSIVITLLARISDGRRRWGINSHRLRMRTSSQRQWQNKCSDCNPFLHVFPHSVESSAPPVLRRDACSLKPGFAQSVAQTIRYQFESAPVH
jgi:hypothetical protein